MFLRQTLARVRANQEPREQQSREYVNPESPLDQFARDLNRAIESLGGEWEGVENATFSIVPSPY